MSGIAGQAAAALAQGPAALVTVIATEGSAPRGPGARLLVTADGQVGTIGGGALEWRAAEQARAILTLPPGSWRVQDYPLGPLLGQCCGGRVRLLLERLAEANWLAKVERGEPVLTSLLTQRVARTAASVAPDPPQARGALPAVGFTLVEPTDTLRRPLRLFGAGHVGTAIARLMPGLPLSLAWFDSRPELANMPGVMHADPDALVACAGEAGEGEAVLILTHDHGLDYRLTAAALGSRARFVGVIGSATKRARFLTRLRRDGVDAQRLTCPIGLPGIAGKEPATIALSALAQLLALGTPA